MPGVEFPNPIFLLAFFLMFLFFMTHKIKHLKFHCIIGFNTGIQSESWRKFFLRIIIKDILELNISLGAIESKINEPDSWLWLLRIFLRTGPWLKVQKLPLHTKNFKISCSLKIQRVIWQSIDHNELQNCNNYVAIKNTSRGKYIHPTNLKAEQSLIITSYKIKPSCENYDYFYDSKNHNLNTIIVAIELDDLIVYIYDTTENLSTFGSCIIYENISRH